MVIEIGKTPEGERVLEMQASFSDTVLAGNRFPLILKTKRERSKISCRAKYKTQIICECSRCLKEFQYEIENEICFFVDHESQNCDYDEFDFYVYNGGNDKIDFSQTIYDDIMTQIPMKPLCRNDCEGILNLVK